jgi:tetratricopeptide (TPR) repeat protein
MTTHEESDGVGFDALANALTGVEDSSSFQALLAARPDLFGEATIEELRELVTVPGLGEAMRPFLDLLEQAEEDPELAWRRYQRAMDKREDEEGRLGQSILQAQAMVEKGEFEAAIQLAESALRSADEQGHWVLRADLHAILATSFRSRGGDVRADLDKAIVHMEEGARGTPNPYLRAERELNLAALYGTRRNGDPNQNLETALRILEEARGRLDEGAPIYVRVMVLNNLARVLQIREEDDRLENLRESLRILDEATALTSAREDPERWALVTINFAETTRLLHAEGEVKLADAEQALQEVADARELKGFESFQGVANSALGEIHRGRAQQTAEDSGRIGLGGGEPAPPGDAEVLELKAAEHHLKLALDLIDPRIHGWQLGSSLDQLGQVYWLAGEADKEIEALRKAIEVQTALAAPGLLMQSGFGLGRGLAQRGEWIEAAKAFGTALEAGRANFHARLENIGRQGELRRAGNVARWAAFALAKTGAIEDAIVVLENGRTRDVRRRLGGGVDEATLSSLPKDARDAYVGAVTKLSSLPKGEAGDQAARELQEIIVWIRGLNGFESFATDVTFSQIVAAAEPHWPLAYVNPTPWGTVVLLVHLDGGEVKTEAGFLDEVSGEQMILDLSMRGWRSSTPKFSYLALAAGGKASSKEEEEAIDDALSHLSPIAEFLGDSLRGLGAKGVTLISSGPVGLSPLHAAPWTENGRSVCLLDHLQVRSAPSATLQAVCLERMHERSDSEPSLLALGNPDLEDPKLDLPGAEREVHEIEAQFPSGRREVALRGNATPEFLLQHLPGVTHLHLACHASAGLFDYGEAQLHLAGGSLNGDEMETLPISTQVAVLSACQTAQLDMANLPDEVSSMSTALLVAGSTAVVATQWPLGDEAAAILMSRFYSDLIENDIEIGEALRRAQLWLRDSESSGKFAHPRHWAPFVLAGA